MEELFNVQLSACLPVCRISCTEGETLLISHLFLCFCFLCRKYQSVLALMHLQKGLEGMWAPEQLRSLPYPGKPVPQLPPPTLERGGGLKQDMRKQRVNRLHLLVL
ncbi:ras-related protein Rab-1B [Platysternon megacephalum]|uniref:Ras-related protein Rab-1B n=1 Tax=Platysternon megacephalum TaxID=55544 RepID=A0A4D9EPQ5_9SAUR|nr:ras-related protein Rab-1B [Platysternon megacephalum]